MQGRHSRIGFLARLRHQTGSLTKHNKPYSAHQWRRRRTGSPINEDTNAIQSMDLVGRKMLDDKEATNPMMDEIKTVRLKHPNMAMAVRKGCESHHEAAK